MLPIIAALLPTWLSNTGIQQFHYVMSLVEGMDIGFFWRVDRKCRSW